MAESTSLEQHVISLRESFPRWRNLDLLYSYLSDLADAKDEGPIPAMRISFAQGKHGDCMIEFSKDELRKLLSKKDTVAGAAFAALRDLTALQYSKELDIIAESAVAAMQLIQKHAG